MALAAILSSLISFCYQYLEAARALGWGWDLVSVFRPALIACLTFLAVASLLPFSHSAWTMAAIVLAAVLVFAATLIRQFRTLL